MTRDEAVEMVVKALPYPEHITAWDTATEEGVVRFTWRGDRFRYSYTGSGMVEEVDDCFLRSSNLAILVEYAIKRAYINRRP